MLIQQEDILKKQLRERAFCRTYLLYGSEGFLKQFYANRIVNLAVEPDFRDFNLHVLDGKETTLDEISDCVLAFPMMGEYTCTLVKDYPLTDFAGERGKTDSAFEALLKDLPETSILVFWMDTVEVDEKNSKWAKLLKLFDAAGAAVRLDKRSLSALCKLLEDSAKKKGAVLSRENALYIISLVGDDISTLKNEFDKILAYTGEKEITRDIIDSLAVVSVEAKIFSLSKDLVQQNADKAYETLANLLKLREDPVKILAVLSKAYCDMYRAVTAKQKGVPNSELEQLFPAAYRGRSFILNNASRDAGKLTAPRLATALEVLWDADKTLKSTSADGKIVLEQLLLRLMRI